MPRGNRHLIAIVCTAVQVLRMPEPVRTIAGYNQTDKHSSLEAISSMQVQAFDPWQIGELLCGQYRIVERLSQSDQCIAYRAYHESWQHPIRLKVFRDLSDVHKANLEAWSTLALHPLIASCYYLRDLQGYSVAVSEYVFGEPVQPPLSTQRGQLPTSPGPVATLLDLAIQTAWGLQYAHGRGILHGNLHWGNLIRTATGTIRLTDFQPAAATTRTQDAQAWAKLLSDWCQQLTGSAPVFVNTVQAWCQETAFTWPERLEALHHYYQEVCSQPYPQTQPKSEQWQLGGLNNRAVALMDLAQTTGALGCWEQSLQIDPTHPESLYNQGLWQWRSQQISLDVLLARLQPCHAPHVQAWIGFLHLEAGDGAAALAAFDRWQPDSGQSAQTIQRACALAQQRLAQTAYRTLPSPPAATITVLIPSQDGKFLIWGDADGAIVIWDLALNQSTRLSGHADGTIVRLSLTPDNCHLVSLAQAPTADAFELKLWSFRTGQCLTVFPALQTGQSASGLGQSQNCCWSPDGRYSLHDADGIWTLRETATGQVIYALHAGLDAIWLRPDRLTGLSWDQPQAQLVLWDLVQHRPLQRWSVPATCSAIAVLPPQPDAPETYFTVEAHGQLIQWELTEGQPLATWQTNARHVQHMQVSQDAQRLLLQGDTLSLWSLEHNQPISGRELAVTPETTAIALSPDGCSVLLADQQVHGLSLQPQDWHYRAPWQLANCTPQRPVLAAIDPLIQHLHQAEQAWANQNLAQAYDALQHLHHLPLGEHRDRTFELWAKLYPYLLRQQLRATWPLYTFAAHVGAIHQMQCDRDGALVTGSRNGTVKRWSLQSERALGTILGQPRGWLHGFSLSTDRQWLITTSQRDGLQIWPTRSGQPPQTLTAMGETPLCVVALPASPYILGGTAQGQLQLWHLDTGDCVRTWPAHTQAILALCVSPDGQYGVSAEAGSIWKRWHLATGDCVQVVSTAQAGITAIAYSADGQYIVTTAQDHSVMVWQATTGQRLHTLPGHHSPVTAVAVSPDSRYVLSGDETGIAQFWNLRTGARLQTWRLEQGAITTVAVSRTSKYMLLGTTTGDVHVWALDWQLAPPMQPQWDETARPYLEAFLRRQQPRQLLSPRSPALAPQQFWRKFPLGMLALWTVLIWLGTVTGYEIFINTAYPVGTGLLAGGGAMFVWSYFTGRQSGNPTIQLGALFGIVILALVGIVERFQQGWTALGAVCWGVIIAGLMTGPCLGLWRSQATIRPLGFQSTQTLKKFWGQGGATLLLFCTVALGISLEWVLVQGSVPRGWPVVGVTVAAVFSEAIAIWRRGWRSQRFVKQLGILSVVLLTSFTWLLPSRLGVVPQRACETESGLHDYLARGGTPNGQLLSSVSHSLLECALVYPDLTFLQTLIEHPTPLRWLNSQGEGLLHLAVQAKNIPAIKALLAADSPINLKDSQGRTALHYAPTAPITSLLIQAGADVNVVAPQVGSPLQQAIRTDQLTSAQMLLRHQADPNLRCEATECEDDTALYSAIRHDRLDVLQLLLTYDVDLTLRDRNEQTPLEYAQSLNNTTAVTLLQNAIDPES